MHKFTLLIIIQVFCLPTFAQEVTLKGKVFDNNNAQGIDFVNVYIDSVFNPVLSQQGGQYTINKLESGTHTLYAMHIAYTKFYKEINLAPGQNTIDIALIPNFDTLSPIVITGTGTHHRIDNAPVQTEIITRKDIENLSGKSVEEVISNISSSIDYSSSSMGTNLKINGLGQDYVLILINGKRLTGGVGGYADLSRINSEDIEQIEIVKGASSTLYGSDAIAGVINIITKKPKQNISASNSTRAGGYGVLKQLNAISYNYGKLTGKTTLNYKQKDGYQLNNLELNSKWENNHDLPFLVPTYYKPVNKARAYTISQFLEYNFSTKLSINTNISWYEKRLYFPFKAQMHNYYYNNRNLSLGGRYKLQNKNYIDFNVDCNNYLYYTEYPYKYNESYISSSDVTNITYYPGDRFKNSDQVNIISQAKGVFSLNSKNILSVGAEVNSEYLEAQYSLTSPNVKAITYAVYGQDEVKLLPKLTIVTGLRAIYHNKSGFILTPKFTAMFKEARFTHRLTYSKGFKKPTLKELYYYYESDRMGMYRLYLGNADLKPQQSHYLALSTEFKVNKFQTGINIYLNRINNKIDYRIDSTSYDHRRRGIEETKKRYNIDKAQNIGADWHFTQSLFKQLVLSGGYSYVSARNLTQNIRLNGISEHSATFNLRWTKKWKPYHLNITLSGVYKSDRFYLEEDQERSYAKPYQLWKITSSHKLKKIKHCDLTGIVGIDNILDYVDRSPYGSHYGTLNPGRTFFVGLTIKFEKQTQ